MPAGRVAGKVGYSNNYYNGKYAINCGNHDLHEIISSEF